EQEAEQARLEAEVARSSVRIEEIDQGLLEKKAMAEQVIGQRRAREDLEAKAVAKVQGALREVDDQEMRVKAQQKRVEALRQEFEGGMRREGEAKEEANAVERIIQEFEGGVRRKGEAKEEANAVERMIQVI
ncbi:hypothetical protein T484DRAFT_1769636, partial [Baffinella frigidus]